MMSHTYDHIMIARVGRGCAVIVGIAAAVSAGWNPYMLATAIEQVQIILLGSFMVFWGFNY